MVKLKADIASPEDKEALAEALFYLREPTTGSVEGDVKRLGSMIDEYVEYILFPSGPELLTI